MVDNLECLLPARQTLKTASANEWLVFHESACSSCASKVNVRSGSGLRTGGERSKHYDEAYRTARHAH